MQNEAIIYDSTEIRPLPKWLLDQKSGHASIQPEEIVMKEDNSLKISFIVTACFIILLVAFLTFFIVRKHKDQIS